MAIKVRFTGNHRTGGESGRDGVGSAGVSGCPAAGFTTVHEGTACCLARSGGETLACPTVGVNLVSESFAFAYLGNKAITLANKFFKHPNGTIIEGFGIVQDVPVCFEIQDFDILIGPPIEQLLINTPRLDSLKITLGGNEFSVPFSRARITLTDTLPENEFAEEVMAVPPHESPETLLENEVPNFIKQEPEPGETDELPIMELPPRPPLELKPLPEGLCYAFLHNDKEAPIIISYKLSEEETQRLLMSFGLRNAPASFQRCMMSIFSNIIEDIMEVFMDDFSVYGKTFGHCLLNLDKVFQRCQEKDLVLNWEKCHFMVREGIVLGHRVSERGIEVDRAKIDVIDQLPPPVNIKGIHSFLGHAGFYRRFIKDFSTIARPLTNLLAKDAPFGFDDACLKSFEILKKALVSAPIIQPPDWTLPFEIMCDASDFAVGAVLGQTKD
uniref:Retrotransposon protein, putative, Ty3-gypsy subclass n=2 Tax=Oryza sativa subsp. japonica TaxID=39947 RepID=Q53KB3_ORYSJ|nr:retrotransposon protein, putative, Ty3-gypsy sub-class [Oryza sativa Japonica Group]ABA93430.1 retrotransposon protein, putative, Ty3-gypsy subclass [Oryza sativa Japonica Group]